MSEESLIGEFGEPDEPILSHREKEIRIKYVEEYFVDHSPRRAAIRVGYSEPFVDEFVRRMNADAFVQRLISARTKQIALDPRGEDDETKRVIRARLLAESTYHGPGSSHAARVSALAKLMSLYGMDAPTVVKAEHNHRGGVMFVPPIATSLEDWEKAAVKSQQDLVSNARH